MAILSNDHQKVGGKQYFEDDVQLEVIPKGIRRDVYTPTADETISANRSGAFVILNDSIDIKLPTPEVGLNYKFLKNANASATSTIISTVDGSQVSNLLTGTINDDNDGWIATSNVDTITFISTATEGDFVDVRCVTTDGGGTAATTTLSTADGDAVTSLAEDDKITFISTDGTSKTYSIVHGGADGTGAVATGTVIELGADTGAATAQAAEVDCIAVNINVGTTTQSGFLTELKTAVEHANGHNGKITAAAVSGTGDGAQTMVFTQTEAGIGGNTVTTIETGLGDLTAPDFDQTVSGVWQFNGYTDVDGGITAT